MANISKAELKSQINDILRTNDLNTLSSKMVRSILEKKLGVNLDTRKKEIDQIAMSFINASSDSDSDSDCSNNSNNAIVKKGNTKVSDSFRASKKDDFEAGKRRRRGSYDSSCSSSSNNQSANCSRSSSNGNSSEDEDCDDNKPNNDTSQKQTKIERKSDGNSSDLSDLSDPESEFSYENKAVSRPPVTRKKRMPTSTSNGVATATKKKKTKENVISKKKKDSDLMESAEELSEKQEDSKSNQLMVDEDAALARQLVKDEWNLRSRPSRAGKRQSKPRAKKTNEGRKGTSAYSRKCTLSYELAEVMQCPEMARHDVVKKMWEIVRERNLLDPQNKQFAICDEQLLSVFGTKRFRMFSMMKHLKHHIKDEPH